MISCLKGHKLLYAMPTSQSQTNDTAADKSEGVGVRVRSARHNLNMEQQQLAEQSNVPLPTLKDIERGRTKNPHPKTLEALAGVLRVDAGFLRTGNQPPAPVAPKV